MFSNIFFSFEIRAVCEIMWKNVVDLDMPRDSMAYVICMLDDRGCRNTIRIYNTYCFSMATVTRTRLSVTLYVHGVSFISNVFFRSCLVV